MHSFRFSFKKDTYVLIFSICLLILFSLKYSFWQHHFCWPILHFMILMYCSSFTDTNFSSFSSLSAVLRLSPAFEMEDRSTDPLYYFLFSIEKTNGKREQALHIFRFNLTETADFIIFIFVWQSFYQYLFVREK